jgi:lipopolysaccharide assembly protein A
LKYLMWLLNAAIFFALFAFALNNQDSVTLRLFFGAQWDAPLILALLIALMIGVFLGVLVMLPLWLRAKKARREKAHATSSDASTLMEGDSTLIQGAHDPRHGL